jgi:hypothetical protein
MKELLTYHEEEKQPEVIPAVDEVLSLLREKWMGEKNDKKKAELFKKIDSVLDERFRLMKLRDAEQL